MIPVLRKPSAVLRSVDLSWVVPRAIWVGVVLNAVAGSVSSQLVGVVSLRLQWVACVQRCQRHITMITTSVIMYLSRETDSSHTCIPLTLCTPSRWWRARRAGHRRGGVVISARNAAPSSTPRRLQKVRHCVALTHTLQSCGSLLQSERRNR
jgi:hypothetical protein